MPSVVKFAPLCGGAHDDAPFCYLLDIDGYRILLDCGWNDTFDVVFLEPLKKVAGSIHAVLLSHPDLAHLGALPYAFAKLGLSCPVFGTLPVYNMGLMFLYDAHQAHATREDFHTFSLDDVDLAFHHERWVQLKFQQTVFLPEVPGKPKGITVTPYPAGHMLGGTMWRIIKETDEIIYAVSINHAQEHHLDGCVLQAKTAGFIRPALMITDSNCAYTRDDASRKQRDSDVFDNIMRTFEAGGDVLIPVDSAGRVLELALMLEQKWVTNANDVRRRGFGACMLTHQSDDTIKFAQTMTEWMSEKVQKDVEKNSLQWTFQLKNVRACMDVSSLAQVPQPRVILASMETLRIGFALDLFLSIAEQPRNMLLLVQRGHKNSLARTLIENPDLKNVMVEQRRRVHLEGAELLDYMRKLERRRLEATNDLTAINDATNMDEEEEEEAMTDLVAPGTEDDTSTAAAGAPTSKTFFKHARTYPMFSFPEPKGNYDEYGEILDPQIFEAANAAQVAMDVDIRSGPQSAPPGSIPETTPAAQEIPTKCVSQTFNVRIACSVRYVDADGLTNLSSMKNILETMQPRKLIVINGDERSTAMFRSMCKTAKVTEDVITPALKEIVDVSSTTDLIPVTLTDALVSSIRTASMGDYELSFVSAKLTQNKEASSMVLDIVPAVTTANDKPNHTPIFIGELMLSSFRLLLEREGYHVEMPKEGMLTCDSEVCIRKTETGRLTLEGPLSPNYFKIRSLLYSQYAIV